MKKESNLNLVSTPVAGDASVSNQEPDLIKESLERAGKSDEEVSAVVTIDQAQTLADKNRALPGVLQQALLDTRVLDLSMFSCLADKVELSDSKAAATLFLSLNAMKGFNGKILDDKGKVRQDVLEALARSGYWGLPIPQEWGGSGASKFFCGRAIVAMGSQVAEILGGLLSIERLIGAAGPLIWKGSAEQKERLLKPLAEGFVRSGFAGTEPQVGCNITRAGTYGEVEGEDILVYGEKLFISNAWYGHEVALLLSIDDHLRVLIVRLPERDSGEFAIVNYDIHALRQIHNKGLWFNGLRVPKANLLEGDGLSIIFHDLDEGRFAVAATAAARMRRILASCVPWVQFRETFGEKLEKRQYIQQLLALQAAYIVGSEVLVDWSASLIDHGFQGDVSSMIAKTRATDWLRDAATRLGMFVHGGRFVLGGHTIGDNLADDMVSSVYEGPNPMLGKASVKAVAKAFVEVHLKPFMIALNKSGIDIRRLRFAPKQIMGTMKYLWSKRAPIMANHGELVKSTYGLAAYIFKISLRAPSVEWNRTLTPEFEDHLKFARKAWFKWRRNFILKVIAYQDSLADEDILMLEEFYEPMAAIATMFCAVTASSLALYNHDRGTHAALHMLCLELRVILAGEKRTSGRYKKAVKELSGMVVSGQFGRLDSVPQADILRPY